LPLLACKTGDTIFTMISGIDPRNDYVFKRLCSDEDNALLLVDLLNAVLRFPAGRLVSGVDLLNPFVDKDYAEGKVPILDVRARDDLGRQFLVEMQRKLRGAFAKRLLYYWSGAHAEQLFKGETYELLQPTYLICFIDDTLFQDSAYHHCFRVYDDTHGVLLCKDLEIHVVELSKFTVPVEALQTPLDRWCYFFKHGTALDPAKLPPTLDNPMIRKAVEVLVKISQAEIERQRAAERLRAQYDYQDSMTSAKVAGRQEGREEGRQEGRQEGIEIGVEIGFEKGTRIGHIQILQKLLGQPETPTAQLRQKPETDLVQLEETLLRLLQEGKKPINGTPPTDKA
jgi:predicted transposase/invertase (TIGR01784 family)